MARAIAKHNRRRAGSAGASTTEYILLLAGSMLFVTAGLSLFQQTIVEKTVEASIQLELAEVEDGGGTYGVRRCTAILAGLINPRNEEELTFCLGGTRAPAGTGNELNPNIRNPTR
jgi:hypothetical protein